MTLKPTERLFGDLLEGSRFFEEVAGSWDNYQLLEAAESSQRFSIHLNHRPIIPSYQQQGRRDDLGQIRTRQIGPPTA